MRRQTNNHQVTLRSWLNAICISLVCAQSMFAEDSAATKALKERNKEFREEVIEVADNVYTAVGFSVSNVSMIVGKTGVVIIDTGLDTFRAKKILAEFRKITDKAVRAIIITHGHGDHTGGVSVFVGDGKPEIWAHANFESEARHWKRAGLTVQKLRGARQGGFRLPRTQRINNGIAPAQYPKRQGSVFNSQAVKPTRLLRSKRNKLDIAGISLELVQSPGETNDQIYVVIPDRKVLFSGDNFYKSFPNLYAIRGTPKRDVRLWAKSLTAMLNKKPKVLVGGHTRPIIGRDKVKSVLTDFRDAVKFVHDKTAEGMNKGMTADQLVKYVKLPDRLAKKEYLREFYGNVEWGVRHVFSFYVGWFDGNPTNLGRLSPKEEATRMVKLAGGKDRLLQRAREAFKKGDAQWTAQLTDYLLALDPNSKTAKSLKADALTVLGERCLTATGRNYYLTVAQELRQPTTGHKPTKGRKD